MERVTSWFVRNREAIGIVVAGVCGIVLILFLASKLSVMSVAQAERATSAPITPYESIPQREAIIQLLAEDAKVEGTATWYTNHGPVFNCEIVRMPVDLSPVGLVRVRSNRDHFVYITEIPCKDGSVYVYSDEFISVLTQVKGAKQ